METITIDIINPKAKNLLKNLADLNLIKIKKKKAKPELQELLEKLRSKAEDALSMEEIAEDVKAVRKAKRNKQIPIHSPN